MSTKQTPEQTRDESIKASKKTYLAAVSAAKAAQEATVREAWAKFIESSSEPTLKAA
jgi:hypothetical protein